MNFFPTDQSLADKLIVHFKSGGTEEELPPQWLNEYRKMKSARDLLNTHTKLSICVTLFVELYKPISEATAYRYCSLAQHLFGALAGNNKEFMRQLLFEKAESTYAFAKLKGDAKAMVGALKEMKSILGLDREDNTATDPSKLQRHNNITVFIGSGEDFKQLTETEIQALPPRKKEKILNRITEGLIPQDIDFIDVKTEK